MTNGDKPTNNVRDLRPRPDGDDASTPARRYSIAETLRVDAAVDRVAATPTRQTAEPFEAKPVQDVQELDQPAAIGVDVDHEQDEVQWADGTPTDVPAKRRGLRKPKVETVAVAIGDAPIVAPEPPNSAADEHDVFEAPVEQPPQAVVELSGVDSEPELAPRPPVAVGSARPRPSGDDWSAERPPVRAEPVDASQKDPGEGWGRGRYLAPLGLLVVGLVAAVVIVGALTSHGHATALNGSAQTRHKTHASASNVVTVTVPATVTSTTRAKSAARLKSKHKPKPKADKRTVTTATVTSTPVVSSPPAATTTPAVTRTPVVTSTAKVTTSSTSAPKTTTPSNTSRSSSTHSSSSTSGGLPDVQQTAQQP